MYIRRQGSGELSPPLPASLCAESFLLFASHTRTASFGTSLAPPARDRFCSVLCTLASAVVVSVARLGTFLLRESRLRGIDSCASHACVCLDSLLRRSLLRRSSVFRAWTPPPGLLHPLRSSVSLMSAFDRGFRPWTPSQRELRFDADLSVAPSRVVVSPSGPSPHPSVLPSLGTETSPRAPRLAAQALLGRLELLHGGDSAITQLCGALEELLIRKSTTPLSR